VSKTLHLDIQKDKLTNAYFIDDMPVSFSEILWYIETNSITMVHMVTTEKGKKLLEGFVPYRNKQHFTKVLLRTSKAQIRS